MSSIQTGRSKKVEFKTSDPIGDLNELSHIMLNLRHHTQLWNHHYGGLHRTNKKRWEDKADEWLRSHSSVDKINSVIEDDEE